MQAARSPFAEADALLDRLASEADAFVFDFHAEVTSEKVAMGWHLDGRAAAVLGTHTHVPTADARVLPQGTAFISDVGMTGSKSSVLGVRWEQALEGFRTQMPQRFETADEDIWVNAVVVDVNERGLADSIEPVSDGGVDPRLTSRTLSLAPPASFVPPKNPPVSWTAAPPRWVRSSRRPGPPVSTTLPTSTMGAASRASPVLTGSRFTRSSSGRSRPWTIWSTAARRAPIPRRATAPGS